MVGRRTIRFGKGAFLIKKGSWRSFHRLPIAAAVVALAVIGSNANALPANGIDTQDPANDPPCLSNLEATLTANPAAINLGTSSTLQWSVHTPSGCSTLKFDVAGQAVGKSGSLAVSPSSNASYLMRATYGTRVRGIASVNVNVILPPVINIIANNQTSLFVQALATPGTTINVANNVALNLSYREDLTVADGVTLRGGRTSNQPGPRLFTTTRPKPLLHIRGDNVRITGVRLEGAEMGIGDGSDNLAKGIIVDSANSVEIDHNEIYGWSGIGVQITDAGERIDYALNPETVHIHDNYIHHNQHYAKDGYGVATAAGAYALIDQNVFDWNRHAIESNGERTTGYHAYRNLVLPHGGYHRWWPWPIGWQHTHSFDVHGTDNCGISDVFSDAAYNCGDGGHDVDIRYNSFYYTDGANFKLRGTPGLQPFGAFVIDNVFANDDEDDAIKQTESGLYAADNQFGVNAMNELGSGDFDGDGINDTFLATGETWWFSSGGTGPWTYLNQSHLRMSQLTLGNFDSFKGCDVMSGGLISSGGTGPFKPLLKAPIGTIGRKLAVFQ
jgi:hypothetical protein